MQSIERRLGLFSVIVISISSMIGPGIFLLPGIAFELTGSSLFLAYGLAALIILPAAMSKAELATAMPANGGTYVYIERTFGPLMGMISGLGLYASILLKASFALFGLGAYFTIFSDLPLIPTVLSFLGAITVLNLFGVGKVSQLLSFILGLTILSLFALIFGASNSYDQTNLLPLLPNGLEGLASATALVFVSFAGVTKVAAIAEEVKNPEKNLPRGILLSLLLVTIFYSAISLALALALPQNEIAGVNTPLYDLALKTIHPTFAKIIAVIAVLTMINTSNTGLLAGSRFPFAMSRDRLLPDIFGRLSSRYLTPVFSILVSGLFVALVLLGLDVAKIAKLASAFMIAIYMMENICVIVLRESRAQWYKPKYKSPLYPWIQVLGSLLCLLLLYAMGTLAIVALVTTAIPSLILYFIYSRKRTDRKGVIGIKGKRSDLVSAPIFHHSNFYDIKRRANVVVALFGKEKSADTLIEVGLAMADYTEIEVAALIEVPEQTSLDDVIEEPGEFKSLQRRLEVIKVEKNTHISFDSVVTHDLPRSVFEISQCVSCRWLMIEWRGRSRGTFTFHQPVGWLKSHLNCKLAVFKDAGIRYFRKFLVVLQGDGNDDLVIESAEHLSQVYQAEMKIVKIICDNESKCDEAAEFEKLKLVSDKINASSKIEIVQNQDPANYLIKESVQFDLMILGGKEHGFWYYLFAHFEERVMAKAACSVMAVSSTISLQGNELKQLSGDPHI